jgi:hypothetical protein
MSDGHVYVTACGFGKRIVAARSPLECVREAGGAVVVTVGANTKRVFRDDPPAAGLTDGCHVADVIAGPQWPDWYLEAGPYRIRFPEGWTVVVPGGTTPAYFLVASGDRAVFVQTAQNVPAGDRLIAPGDSVLDRGTRGPFEWVEVSYPHEGGMWRQRRVVVGVDARPRALVVAQAPQSSFAAARELLTAIVDGIVFT